MFRTFGAGNSLLLWTFLTRRGSQFSHDFPHRARRSRVYGISSTLRKLPVVFQPDRHSAALGVRSPSTRTSWVPAGILNAHAIWDALFIRQLKLGISISPSEKVATATPSTRIF